MQNSELGVKMAGLVCAEQCVRCSDGLTGV